MDTNEKKDYLMEVHNQIIGWTNNCDTKASIVLAVVGVLVSIAFANDYILDTISVQMKNIIKFWSDGIGGFCVVSMIMFLSLGGVFIFIGICFYNAIKALRANINCLDDSVIFFGKIARLSKDAYFDKVKNITEEEYQQDKLSQIYNCATICNAKFKYYNKSIGALLKGLLSFVAFIVCVIILNAL